MSSTTEDAIDLLKHTSYFYDASDGLLEALAGEFCDSNFFGLVSDRYAFDFRHTHAAFCHIERDL